MLGEVPVEIDDPPPLDRYVGLPREQAGVLDGDGELISHRLQDNNIFLLEGAWVDTLYIQRSDYLVANRQWKRHLGSSDRQVRVCVVDRVLPHLDGDPRSPRAGNVAHDPHLAHSQPVTRAQHSSAALRRGGFEHGILACLVNEEHPCVIIAESV